MYSINKKKSSSIPSKAKVEKMNSLFPGIAEDVCEAILVCVDWNLERAVNYLKDDLEGFWVSETKMKDTSEWPTLPKTNTLLKDNVIRTSASSGPKQVTRLASGSQISVKDPQTFTDPSRLIYTHVIGQPKTEVHNVPAMPVKNVEEIMWHPVIRNPRKKIDHNALYLSLQEELKFENSRRIIQMVSARSGFTVPKVLILLRGVPGSGKSRLTDIIVGVSERGVSCSADNHFINQFGQYVFQSSELSIAHAKAKTSCYRAMEENVTPIVVDNTNTQAWEMLPYVESALKFGYDIEILEPNTPWKRNAQILAKKTCHGVSKAKIKQMLDRFEDNLTAPKLIDMLRKLETKPIRINDFPRKDSSLKEVERTMNESQPRGVVGQWKPKSLEANVPSNAFLSNPHCSAQSNFVAFDGVSGTPTFPPINMMDTTRNFPFLSTSLGRSSSVKIKSYLEQNDASPHFENFHRSRVGSSNNYREVNKECGDIHASSFHTLKKSESDVVISSHKSSQLLPHKNGRRNSDANNFDYTIDTEVSKIFSGDKSEEGFEDNVNLLNAQEAADALLNLFPDLPGESLSDLSLQCGSNLNWSTDLLLEGGYTMLGTMDGPRKSELFKSRRPLSSSENFLSQEKSSNGFSNFKAGSIRTCPTMEPDRSHSVPPGFEGKCPTMEPDWSHSVPPGFAGRCENINSVDTDPRKTSKCQGVRNHVDDEMELFDPVDGDDWFDLELNPEFVSQVIHAYSDLKSLNISGLSKENLRIRVPPTLGFDLFQIFSMTLLQNTVDQTARQDIDSPNNKENVEFEQYEDTEDDEIISQVLQMEELTSSDSPDLEKIMELEAKLSARDARDTQAQLSQNRSTLADKLKLDKLKSGFPTISKAEIELVYAKCKCSFDEALVILKSHHGSKFVGITDISGGKKLNSRVGSFDADTHPQPSLDRSNGRESTFYVSKLKEDSWTAQDWRRNALVHHLWRLDCQRKARECRSGSEKWTASIYYLQKAKAHTAIMKRANEKAAGLILKDLNAKHANAKEDTLDLHHLYVTEAIAALDKYLKGRIIYVNKNTIRRLDLRIITGQGNNSQGHVSKLAPAVVDYLRRRHLSFMEMTGAVVVTLRYSETRMYDVQT